MIGLHEGTYALDGGALTNQGVHLLDLLRYLAGEVKWVYADITTLGANIEVEDTGVVILEFENGGKGVIEITTAARPDDLNHPSQFLGSKGLAMVGGWATNELHCSPKQMKKKLIVKYFQMFMVSVIKKFIPVYTTL